MINIDPRLCAGPKFGLATIPSISQEINGPNVAKKLFRRIDLGTLTMIWKIVWMKAF
jgi:hypothetical protein